MKNFIGWAIAGGVVAIGALGAVASATSFYFGGFTALLWAMGVTDPDTAIRAVVGAAAVFLMGAVTFAVVLVFTQ